MELSNQIDNSTLLQLLTLVLLIQISRQLEAKHVEIHKPVEMPQAHEVVASDARQAPEAPETQEQIAVSEDTADEASDISPADDTPEASDEPSTVVKEHELIETLNDTQEDAQEAHERTISFVERELIRRAELENSRPH